MYTAVGLQEEGGFLFSRQVNSKNPQEVYNYLSKEFGSEIDQILLIGTPDEGVIYHWNLGKDYGEGDSP